MEAKTEIICKCGSVIKEMEWDYSINDEGEEWSSYVAYCKKCGMEWETTEWGECQSEEEAQEVLQDYIKEN